MVEVDYPSGPFFEHHHVVFAVDMEERGGKGLREQGFAYLAHGYECPHANPMLTGWGSIHDQQSIHSKDTDKTYSCG